MKKIVIIMVAILTTTIFSGCSSIESNVGGFELIKGTYGTTDEDDFVWLTLEENDNFTFANPLWSNIPATGVFKVDDKQLILMTNISEIFFDINDGGLTFNKDASTISDEEYPPLRDLNDETRLEILPTE